MVDMKKLIEFKQYTRTELVYWKAGAVDAEKTMHKIMDHYLRIYPEEDAKFWEEIGGIVLKLRTKRKVS